MSAVIQAAETPNIVGIDRPTARFYRRLFETIRRERPSLDTVRSILSQSSSTLSHAIICRLAAAVGSQFPDLVDKPLAWAVSVLPAGRSLTHSVFTAVAVSAVVYCVAARLDRREPALAFIVGYASHLAGDALPKLPAGDFDSLTFLLWPLLPLPEYEGAEPVVANLAEVVAAPAAYLLASPVRLAFLVAVFAVWSADGFPGVAGVGRYLTRSVSRRPD